MYTKIIPRIITAVWLAHLVVCWALVEEVAGSNQRRYGEKKMSVGSALDYKARDRWLNSYKVFTGLNPGNDKAKPLEETSQLTQVVVRQTSLVRMTEVTTHDLLRKKREVSVNMQIHK